jgi:hypothetical protein
VVAADPDREAPVSIGAPSAISESPGTVYQPIVFPASTASIKVDGVGTLGTLLGFSAFNASNGAATFRFHDGVGSQYVGSLCALQTVAASSNISAWWGPQGLLVGTQLYLERVSGLTEIVCYGY